MSLFLQNVLDGKLPEGMKQLEQLLRLFAALEGQCQAWALSRSAIWTSRSRRRIASRTAGLRRRVLADRRPRPGTYGRLSASIAEVSIRLDRTAIVETVRIAPTVTWCAAPRLSTNRPYSVENEIDPDAEIPTLPVRRSPHSDRRTAGTGLSRSARSSRREASIVVRRSPRRKRRHPPVPGGEAGHTARTSSAHAPSSVAAV